MKEKLAYDLTAKAVEKKMKALEKKVVKLNGEFWAEHNEIVADTLKIDPKRYNELIQAGALICTARIESRRSAKTDTQFDSAQRSILKEINRRVHGVAITYINSSQHSWSDHVVIFKSGYTVPTINRDALKIADSWDSPHVIKSHALVAELKQIIVQAGKFHADVTQIIMPIRSYRVLLDQFPEAAKLLPAPAKAAGNMIPVELINDVRERLKAGIPA